MCAEDDATYCPFFQHAIEVIGRRWTGTILRVLGDRELRFGEIRSSIPGLSDRLLDTRLTELIAEDIAARVGPDNEPRYRVTAKGAALEPVFGSIADWASAHSDGEPHELPGRAAQGIT